MWRVLSQNYQWIFSGIGVLIIGLVIQHWVRKPKSTIKVKNLSLTNSAIASGSNISQTVQNIVQTVAPNAAPARSEEHPTPGEIRDHIATLPPYGQLDACQHYEGLPVRWRVLLFAVEKSPTEICEVTLRIPDKAALAIFCQVSTTDCPRLRVAKTDTPVEVSGFIERVRAGGLAIRLRDAKIVFLDE